MQISRILKIRLEIKHKNRNVKANKKLKIRGLNFGKTAE